MYAAARTAAVEILHGRTAIYTRAEVVRPLLKRMGWPKSGRTLIDPSAGASARRRPMLDPVAEGHQRGYLFPFDERVEANAQTMEQVKVVGPWSEDLRWDIVIPDEIWEKTGPPEDPAARLHISCLRFNLAGMPMHVEAFAVRHEPDEGWVSDVPANSEFNLDDEISAVYTLRGFDPPDPIEIMGRDYILVCYPTG